jgi:spore germination protein GerM
MRLLRALAIFALLVVAMFAGYRYFKHSQKSPGNAVAVYYTKTDGRTLGRWNVSLGTARDLASVAFYATVQALAGPPPDIEAVRFPPGTIARTVRVNGSTATVDLGGAIASEQSGSFAEDGEFKALVWTLTALPGISAVQVRLDGARVPTLPGGHLELDEPLTRQSW